MLVSGIRGHTRWRVVTNRVRLRFCCSMGFSPKQVFFESAPFEAGVFEICLFEAASCRAMFIRAYQPKKGTPPNGEHGYRRVLVRMGVCGGWGWVWSAGRGEVPWLSLYSAVFLASLVIIADFVGIFAHSCCQGGPCESLASSRAKFRLVVHAGSSTQGGAKFRWSGDSRIRNRRLGFITISFV